MKSVKDIEQSIKKLAVESGDRIHGRILEKLLRKLDKSKRQATGEQANIWSIIMKSRINKIAAAAVIIIAVLLGVNFIGVPDMTNVAWADVAEKVKNIETYVFRMREIKTTEPRKEGFEFATERETIVHRSDRYGERTETYTNGELSTQSFTNLEKNEFIGVMPPAKIYEREPLTEERIQRFHNRHPKKIVAWLLQGDYVELGRDKLDGKNVQGVEIYDPAVLYENPPAVKDFAACLWIDTETELPVWAEIRFVEEGSTLQSTIVMDRFQWGAELDAGIFEPNIPSDYRLETNESRYKTQQQDTPSIEEPVLRKMDLPDISDLTLLDIDDSKPETITRLVGHIGVWKAQDRIMSAWPAYSDVKQQLSEELRTKLSTENLQNEQLMATAVALREKFWDKGGRLSKTSYPYGYAARILLEITYDEKPEDMTITDELVETIQSIELFWSFKPDSEERVHNTELRAQLKQLRSKQFEQIEREISAGRKLTWADFVRVNDLGIICGWTKDFEYGTNVAVWLIEKAEPGGWTAYLKPLRNMQRQFAKDESYNYNILRATRCEFPEEYRYHGLPSFKGPKKRGAKPLHILESNPVWYGN
ncbi:MAG: glutathione S-transferase family protein [Planctomycetota bacterium]|jgi:outer membrane lipoprotein-sorting protein